MTTLETIVFYCLIFVTVIMFSTWLYKRKSYKYGSFYNTEEVATLKIIPGITILYSIILLIFFIMELNKLHLIYIFPIVYYIAAYRQVMRLTKDEWWRK